MLFLLLFGSVRGLFALHAIEGAALKLLPKGSALWNPAGLARPERANLRRNFDMTVHARPLFLLCYALNKKRSELLNSERTI